MAEQPGTKTTLHPRKKTFEEVQLDSAPWKPVPYELADAMAVKAIYDGVATPEQQRMALDWIIGKAAGKDDEPYRPGGEHGRRDTDFACGRAFVGRQIVKLVRADPDKLRRK